MSDPGDAEYSTNWSNDNFIGKTWFVYEFLVNFYCMMSIILGMDIGEKEKQLPSLLSLKVDPPDQLTESNPSEVVLPAALEEVLALKNQRALELGDEDVAQLKIRSKVDHDSDEGEENALDNRDDKLSSAKSVKNKRKKKKKKNRNRQKKEGETKDDKKKPSNVETGEKDVEVE